MLKLALCAQSRGDRDDQERFMPIDDVNDLSLSEEDLDEQYDLVWFRRCDSTLYA